MEDSTKKQEHFVLVDGSCHGACCWYKLIPMLENAGHQVTALDMAASGINLKKIDELRTLRDYSEPLIRFMASLSDGQKVILVGHSFGGINLSLVMEMFPQKIEVAVFVTAFVPDTQHTPSFIFDQFKAWVPEDYYLDTEFETITDPDESSFTILLFGPEFLLKLYHLSPREDYELGMTLKRPSSTFLQDISKIESKLSKERYGSVKSVYITCLEDQGIPYSFQLWMIDNAGIKEVKSLENTDHMPMFCIPQELCDCLLEIANTE